ncbi:hypothetical protein [Halegenticoccus tardaugens]|uniref:hypothetical protein n=1 Tax=Halegenticoccus tardaugens TaxID=2071624 RepID=UPI00100A8BE9|nr:hypothetical protein [Halegenticoccus tardaugens]
MIRAHEIERRELSVASADATDEGEFEGDGVLEDDRERLIVEALRAHDGEMHVSELASEIAKREATDGRRARSRAVPTHVHRWAACFVSCFGVLSVVGGYHGVSFFSLLSTAGWASLTFGLLVLLQCVSLVEARRSKRDDYEATSVQ